MAIIKCPECGHEISDKAPFCPSCGVAISGKVIICEQCGKAYFSDNAECPFCHQHNVDRQIEEASSTEGVESLANASNHISDEKSQTVNDTDMSVDEKIMSDNSRRNNILIAIVAIAVVCVVGGMCWFFYHQNTLQRESQAYEYAMQSTDPQVVQKYLDTYMDVASDDHIQSIEEHLAALKQVDADWTNAVVSGSKSAIEQYLAQHPESPFKALALHMIDSIDWNVATTANSVEAMETYLEQHADGEHVDDANEKIKGINSKSLQPEEKLMISGVFDSFFNGLNNKDEDAIIGAVNPLLDTFLGKANATRNDVATFMRKIYKSDVSSMNWNSADDYKINKNEVGDGQYEYSVSFSAVQTINHTDGSTTESKYRITAKVNSECRISDFNMVKVLN